VDQTALKEELKELRVCRHEVNEELSRFDLHVHSYYSSDSTLKPEEIVKLAVSRGLAGVAITDHNTVMGGVEGLKVKAERFIVIPGCEVRTSLGDLLGLFISEDVKRKEFLEAVDDVRSQGGIAVLAHPFDKARRSTVRDAEKLAGSVDAVEVINSRCLFNSFNEKAVKLADARGLPITAGSDAHFSMEIGRAYVVASNIGGLEDLRRAILGRRVKVEGSLSPFVTHLMSSICKLRRKASKGVK